MDVNTKNKISNHKLGQMPIGILLFNMSLPMVISMFVLACYNIIDSIFVAKYSEDALEALSLAYPIQFLTIAINIGTNVGVTANISRALGEQKYDKANNVAKHGLVIAIIYSIIFAILGLTLSNTYFRLQTSNETVIKMGTEYLTFVLLFSFGLFIQTTIEKFMQATGKTVGSMISQLTGAIINIILDPILIFGLFGFPKLGVKGAAIATIIGQIIGAFIGAYLNKKINLDIKINFKNFKLNKNIILDIYRIGLPSILTQSISSIVIFCLNMIIIKFPHSISILGIYNKVQSFVFMPVIAINNASIPIISYNYGAKNKNRIIQTIKSSILFSLLIMLVGSLVFFFFPKQILYLFSAKNEMLNIGIIALKIISIHFPLVAFNIIFSSVMQASKKEAYSIIASLTRQIIVLLPSAYLLSKLNNINIVWFCYPISEIVAFIIIIILFRKTYNDQIKELR